MTDKIGSNSVEYLYSDNSNPFNLTVPQGKIMYVPLCFWWRLEPVNWLSINGQQYSREDDIPRYFDEGQVYLTRLIIMKNS